MEKYTLQTTKEDFKKGLINKEEFNLINKYIRQRDRYHLASDNLENYFKEKFSDKIEKSETKDDLFNIKESLRIMPESVAKVLIFRHILIKESTL